MIMNTKLTSLPSLKISSNSVLAALYSSEGSVMERHHFAQSMCILNTEVSPCGFCFPFFVGFLSKEGTIFSKIRVENLTTLLF